MSTMIRKRTTFKFASESEDTEDELHIMDEQEQDELIDKLRQENVTSKRQYLFILQVIIALSCLLHLIYLINRTNPLLAFSTSSEPEPALLPIPFTLLAIVIHLNLSLLVYPERRTLTNIPPLPYLSSFGLSAVAPCLSVLLGRSWVTVAWWSVTGGIVWLAHSMERSVERGDQSIKELENLKYVASGA